ncbi:MAG: nuclear transport factor 2 family protein [Pseudomonadota bacterium]|nr:nuclear transport factor 2 family protein [Pseudomonadota bacterium]
MKDVTQRAVEDYIRYWETLSVRSVRLVEKLAASGISYTDPFHDVRGVDAFEAVLRRYLEGVRLRNIKVINYGFSNDGRTVFLRWEAVIGAADQIALSGMSEVVYDHNALVVGHYNFWDTGSQIMAGAPILKHGFNWLRRHF